MASVTPLSDSLGGIVVTTYYFIKDTSSYLIAYPIVILHTHTYEYDIIEKHNVARLTLHCMGLLLGGNPHP